MKPFPTGAVALMEADLIVDPLGDVWTQYQQSFTNPNVKGFRFRTTWDKVARDGFGKIDETLALCKAHGKFLGISISAGVTCPASVYNLGAGSFTVHNERNEVIGVMPHPWDPVLKTEWSAFVTDFAARYESELAVQYVQITGFQAQNAIYIGSVSDRALLDPIAQAAGYTDAHDGLRQAARDVINLFGQSFRTTVVNLMTVRCWPDDSGQNSDQNWIKDHLLTTFPDHCGVMPGNGLKAQIPTGQLPGVFPYSKGQQSIFPATGTPCGQVYLPPIPVPCPPDPQPINDMLWNAWSDSGQFVECYDRDLNTAGNQSTLALWNEKLADNLPK